MELKVGLNKMNEPIDSCRYGSLQEDPQVHGCGIHNKLALNAEQIQKTKKEISQNMFTWLTMHIYSFLNKNAQTKPTGHETT